MTNGKSIIMNTAREQYNYYIIMLLSCKIALVPTYITQAAALSMYNDIPQFPCLYYNIIMYCCDGVHKHT